jgi:hypothetical protein
VVEFFRESAGSQEMIGGVQGEEEAMWVEEKGVMIQDSEW